MDIYGVLDCGFTIVCAEQYADRWIVILLYHIYHFLRCNKNSRNEIRNHHNIIPYCFSSQKQPQLFLQLMSIKMLIGDYSQTYSYI